MAMKRLLELMAEKKASDIFISVGAPISIKINGLTMPINQQIVTPDTVRALMAEILTERQLKEFNDEYELNTSYPMPGLGSFRVSCFMQRSTPGVVVRFIPGEIPQFDTLEVGCMPAVAEKGGCDGNQFEANERKHHPEALRGERDTEDERHRNE